MMRSILILLCIFWTPVVVTSQNLIQNPGFESGSIPTNHNQVPYATGWNQNCGRSWNVLVPAGNPGSPDLFDSRSLDCRHKIPTNKWGVRNERTGGYRYVGFSGATDSNGPQWYSETVEGTLTAPLTNSCSYMVSFWASAIDGYRQQCNQPLTPITPSANYNKIEVVLRVGNNCTQGKVVYTSPSVTAQTWQNYSGTFSLTAADAAVGYNRIEFRLVQQQAPYGPSHIVYFDDAALSPIMQSPLNPDFQLSATLPSGNSPTYQLTATSAPLPSGAGFWWRVEELDPVTGAVLPNTTVTNPSAWWGNPTTNVFSGYYNNNSPVGVFYQGHKYRITRGTWSACNPWAAISKTVFMCTSCRTPEMRQVPSIQTKPKAGI